MTSCAQCGKYFSPDPREEGYDICNDCEAINIPEPDIPEVDSE